MSIVDGEAVEKDPSYDPQKAKAKQAPKLGDGIYKDGNPKTQFGAVKPGTFETPPIPLYEYSLAHTQGALKYGHFNWRDDPVSISTYTEAAKRHIDLYIAGQENASDTGINNLAHAMCCCSIIIDAAAYGTLIDDRKTTIRHNDPDYNKLGTDEVLERYFEEGKKRVMAIKKEWSGHAEAVRNGTLDVWKADKLLNKPQPPKVVSVFQQEMREYPVRAIGRRGWWNLTGDSATYEVMNVEGEYWHVQNASGQIFQVKFEDFIVDSGR